jgi:hypothetical protein
MTDDREERIRARAHAIWEYEGQPDGRDAEHWSKAEREIDDEDLLQAESTAPSAGTGRING